MTPKKLSPAGDRSIEGLEAGGGWTRRDLGIISRRLAGGPPRGGGGHAAPASPQASATAPAPGRRTRLTAQFAALAILACTLLAYLAAALASNGRSERSAPPSPAGAGEAATVPPASGASSDLTSAPSEPKGPSSASSALGTGEAVVRAFYGALGRADGARASALVIAEKRESRAFSPQAISRFYGELARPLRLLAVKPLARDEYRVRYTYSAGERRCDGEAVVSLTSRDGRDLIRSIHALNGC